MSSSVTISRFFNLGVGQNVIYIYIYKTPNNSITCKDIPMKQNIEYSSGLKLCHYYATARGDFSDFTLKA